VEKRENKGPWNSFSREKRAKNKEDSREAHMKKREVLLRKREEKTACFRYEGFCSIHSKKRKGTLNNHREGNLPEKEGTLNAKKRNLRGGATK